MWRTVLAVVVIAGGVVAAGAALNPGRKDEPTTARPGGDQLASSTTSAAPTSTPASTPPRPAAGAPAQNAAGGRGGAGQRVPVTTAVAEKKPVPLTVDALGTVQTIASVIVRSRAESQITEVLVKDGALVKEGDILFKLDSRGIEAQIKQVEASLQKDLSLLDQARRTVRRQEDLQARGVGALTVLEDSRSNVAGAEAQSHVTEAMLDNLKVQFSYYTVRAPIEGRVGNIALKIGNIAKTGDSVTPLAVINQFKPIYVAFALPQRVLPELRSALTQGTASVSVTPQGFTQVLQGKVAFVDNSFDTASGTISVRGEFENAEELLWPGALCNVVISFRSDESVTVPREAVQSSQTGSFVFMVKDGTAVAQPVTVARTNDREAMIAKGLAGGETVVTDGQMLLSSGTRVEPRTPAGSAPAAAAAEPKKGAT